MKTDLIAGYRLERRIGKGGMASVYAGVQVSLDRPVALKILTNFDADDYSERFINEGRLLARLSHTHIITIYDVGVAEGLHYIAMEHVEGGDLRAKLDAGVSTGFALDLARKIASGLDYAHRQGIVHRDVKPANIMFRRDGTALLTDFGIAKSLIQEKGATATGTILGSPHYMSPEQAQSQAVDGRTDIYSLGILLYEMLVGKRPFEDESDIGVILKHIRDPLPPLPAPLSRYQPLLDRMTAKHPHQRFESAEALLVFLDESGLGAAPGAGNTVSREARTKVLNVHESATLIRRAVAGTSAPAAPKDRLHWAAAAVLVLVMAGLAVPSWVNKQSGHADPTPAVSRADASMPPPVVFAPEAAGPAAAPGAPVPAQEPPKADDPEQVFRLALAYRSGQGAPRDDGAAVRLLKIAADRAHPQAQFYYGLMHGQGRGVEQSYAEAAHWYELAARQGVADAQHLLCLSYALGRGVARDRATGFAWCEIAVVYGSKEAEEALGALRRELRPQELVEVGRVKTALINEIEEPQILTAEVPALPESAGR